MSDKPEWFQILETVQLQQILDEERGLISVQLSASAAEVLTVLKENKVHGALIMDDEQNAVGFVDVYDVLSYVMYCLAGGADDVTQEQLAQFESGDMGDAEHMYGRNFAGSLVDLSGSDKFETIALDASLVDVVKALANYHRLAVVDAEGKVVNVVSQSDIVNFLTQCGHWIWNAVETKVGQLISASDASALVTVPQDCTVVKALLNMYNEKVIAVSVVDAEGAMVANLSASDLVGLTRTELSKLSLPVMEFLQTMNNAVKPPVVVQEDSNLELVFLKMSVYKIHRVWVANEQNVPVGVLTMTDLMKFLTRYDYFL
eukprot:TRINITY_DN473_c0_g1_i1.p1 TRINITY_DN473_c0_g1~~TRINITY_DN473_c0_g1_i1.p1  ORF type:complete len:338 (-),score=95.00 TRINITY_DN473_c0_g1_i1:29-976(-)